MSTSNIAYEIVEINRSNGTPPGVKLSFTSLKQCFTYHVPTPQQIYIALIRDSGGALAVVVESATPSPPLGAFNDVAALEYITAADHLPVVRNALANVHIVIDLRHSPHASNMYGPGMLGTSANQIPPVHFKFARSVEFVVPFLIQDENDITNYRYGSVILIFKKAGHQQEWDVKEFKPYIQVEAHTPDAALDTQYQQLLDHLHKVPLTTLTTGDLLAATLGKLQLVTMSTSLPDGGTKWQIVEAKQVMKARGDHLARIPKVHAQVKASGKDMMKYLVEKKGKSE